MIERIAMCLEITQLAQGASHAIKSKLWNLFEFIFSNFLPIVVINNCWSSLQPLSEENFRADAQFATQLPNDESMSIS